jgi:hypothetical protein
MELALTSITSDHSIKHLDGHWGEHSILVALKCQLFLWESQLVAN